MYFKHVRNEMVRIPPDRLGEDLEHVSLEGAKGLLLNITGGSDMSLTEVSEAAERIKQEVEDLNKKLKIILDRKE